MSHLTKPLPRLLAWLAIAMALLCSRSTGQSFHTQAFDEFDGLPSSLVYDVDIGPDDRVWFVTRSGIAGFDGVNWEVHRRQTDFLFSGTPRYLAFDNQGSPWFCSGALLQGLGVLRDGKWHHVSPTGAQNFEGEIADFDFGPSPSGEALYALLTSGKLLRLENNQWQLVAEQVRDFQSLDESLLLATDRGVFELGLEGALTAISHVPKSPTIAVHQEDLSSGGTQTWILTPDGLGLKTADGFQQLHHQAGQFKDLETNQVHMQPDGFGSLFFGYWGSSKIWDHGELRSLNNPLAVFKGGVTGMALDDHGNLWIASLRGAFRIPPRTWEYYSMSDGLPDNEVSAIAIDKKGHAVLGHNLGLTHSDSLDNPHWTPLPIEVPVGRVGRVLDLQPDTKGGFWIAGHLMGPGYLSEDHEVTWLGEAALRYPRDPSSEDMLVSSFAIDAQGVLWMSAFDQIYRDLGQGFEIVPGATDTLRTRRLVASPNGQIFACTHHRGLLRWDGDRWFAISAPDSASPSESNIYNIYFPKRGPALVGTLGGLRTLVGDKLYPAPWYAEIDAPIYSIFEDSRSWLWIGTERGIYRWNGSNLQHFSVKDGLPGNEVNRDAVLEDDQGRVWFGTNNGLARYSPAREIKNAPPAIRSVLVTSRGMPLAEGQSISAGDNISFDINVASFAGNAPPEFQVRVLGADQGWSELQSATNSIVQFPNAPPGPFQLEIQARHLGGEWGNPFLTNAIQVRQQFWNTTWFRLLILLAAGALVTSLGGMALRSHQAKFLRTELASRTESLRSTELQFERIFSLNPSGQLLLDPATGRIQQANAAAEELFFREDEPLLGVSMAQRLGVLGFAITDGELQAAISSKRGETHIELATMPGLLVPRHLQLLLAHIERAEGALVLLTATDVTTEINLKQQLHQSQSLRAIGQLAGGLAHDFNNLLTTILGHAELLRLENPKDEHTLQRSDAIRGAGERGAELVRKLLAFGRRQVLQPQVINLGVAVATVIDSIGDLLGGTISIESDLDEQVGHVRADRAEIDRAVLNLCLNAREAMPGGGVVKITVREATEAEVKPLPPAKTDQRRWVLLAVKDNGTGMTEEVRARLFEPFFTTKEASGGAGMGLSTVHGIVSQSGGHLEVQSRPGHGTSMLIFLPIVPVKPALFTEPPPPIEPKNEGLRILLVEDQNDVRRTIAALLVGLSYQVSNAEHGVAALDLWHNSPEPFDLVITDIMMPKMDGIELGRELFKLAPELPVLYMSGYLDQAKKRVQGTFLAKPFSVIELRAAVAAATAIEGPLGTPKA